MAAEPKPSESSAGEPQRIESTSAERPKATIHEAELESGPAGRVLRGSEIGFDTAVARRRAGRNVVVCGDDRGANQRTAGRIEAACGPCVRADPHIRHAGPFALPHYQQTRRSPPGPAGHTFYETEKRKARRTT
jgi:hypothetical protein